MKSLVTKKVITFLVSAVILVNPLRLRAEEDGTTTGVFDESVQDLTLVLAAGAGGAILGLSTLSFVDKPKDHLKNIAIGGAIGVVVGVGIVIFGQATKSQSIVMNHPTESMTPETVESFHRLDFSKQKIAENLFAPPTIGYNFSF